jgi:flagellar hook-length control protein FliK
MPSVRASATSKIASAHLHVAQNKADTNKSDEASPFSLLVNSAVSAAGPDKKDAPKSGDKRDGKHAGERHAKTGTTAQAAAQASAQSSDKNSAMPADRQDQAGKRHARTDTPAQALAQGPAQSSGKNIAESADRQGDKQADKCHAITDTPAQALAQIPAQSSGMIAESADRQDDEQADKAHASTDIPAPATPQAPSRAAGKTDKAGKDSAKTEIKTADQTDNSATVTPMPADPASAPAPLAVPQQATTLAGDNADAQISAAPAATPAAAPAAAAQNTQNNQATAPQAGPSDDQTAGDQAKDDQLAAKSQADNARIGDTKTGPRENQANGDSDTAIPANQVAAASDTNAAPPDQIARNQINGRNSGNRTTAHQTDANQTAPHQAISNQTAGNSSLQIPADPVKTTAHAVTAQPATDSRDPAVQNAADETAANQTAPHQAISNQTAAKTVRSGDTRIDEISSARANDTSTASADAPQTAAVAPQLAAQPLQTANPDGGNDIALHVAMPQAATPGPTLTQHVQVSVHAHAPDMPALAVSIATRSQSGARQFDIRLDPPELGRVEVRLSIDAAGKASAHLSADHPQTLDLLQKDAPALTRALRDAGLDVSQDGLNFSLRHQASDGNAQNSFQGGFRGNRNGAFALTATTSIEATSTSAAWRTPADGRLDIRV